MQMYKMTNAQLTRLFVDLLRERKVMGPTRRPGQEGFVKFDWIHDARELVLDYTTTTIPPKKAFFPPVQQLLALWEVEESPPAPQAQEPFILAGVHPCDLAGIDQIDEAYGVPPVDEPWFAARERGTIIGVDCQPDEYCFCPSVGTAESRKPCDLFLTRLPDGFLVEVHTRQGMALVDHADKESAEEGDYDHARQWVEEKQRLITAKISGTMADLAKVLQAGGLNPVWREVAERCYSCGSCNTTCPTCFCFDVKDELDLSMERGVRSRSWDSCQLPQFALVAGGHNFRPERWQRVKHRWHRKFLYLYTRFGRPFCSGCGRCSRACTVDINIADVCNQLITYNNIKEQHGS